MTPGHAATYTTKAERRMKLRIFSMKVAYLVGWRRMMEQSVSTILFRFVADIFLLVNGEHFNVFLTTAFEANRYIFTPA